MIHHDTHNLQLCCFSCRENIYLIRPSLFSTMFTAFVPPQVLPVIAEYPNGLSGLPAARHVGLVSKRGRGLSCAMLEGEGRSVQCWMRPPGVAQLGLAAKPTLIGRKNVKIKGV